MEVGRYGGKGTERGKRQWGEVVVVREPPCDDPGKVPTSLAANERQMALQM